MAAMLKQMVGSGGKEGAGRTSYSIRAFYSFLVIALAGQARVELFDILSGFICAHHFAGLVAH